MQLGWIDFSREDRKKALTILQTLQEEGAVDELGIGVIRDAFANYFFPGTSTLHTRAKYFLIVPYIVHDALAHRKGKSAERVIADIDKRERECAVRMLAKGGKNDRIIGRNALRNGEWVKRPPSDIYWNGIRTYEIFRSCDYPDMSLDDFIRFSCKQMDDPKRFMGKGKSAGDEDYDDVDAHVANVFPFFDIEDLYEEGWDGNPDIALTKREAKYLRKKILSSPKASKSLMGYVLAHNIAVDGYPDFRALYEDLRTELPSDIAEVMKVASDFNYLVFAARVRYNLILSAGKSEEAISHWKRCESSIDKISLVDLNMIKAAKMMERCREDVFVFLRKLKDAFLSRNWDLADALIKRQEIEIKGEDRAKLMHPEKVAEGTWIGGYELDYRMRDAGAILSDIISVTGGERC